METNSKNLSVHQLLNIASELSRFLGHGNNGIQEVLQHLNRNSFVQFGCQSVHFTYLNSLKELKFDLMSGAKVSKEFADSQYFTLDSKLPIVDVFRSGKIMWINTLPDWGVEYPLLKDYPIDFRAETFIAVPVFEGEIVKGVLSLFCGSKLIESDCNNNFFSAIAGLISNTISRK